MGYGLQYVFHEEPVGNKITNYSGFHITAKGFGNLAPEILQ